MTAALTITIDRLPPDPIIDADADPVDSLYCELFWLPTLGPSSLWLLRWAARHTSAGAVTVEPGVLGKHLGLGCGAGRHSPAMRTLHRLDAFGAAERYGDLWLVRTHLRRLSARQLARLPEDLQERHAALVEAVTS